MILGVFKMDNILIPQYKDLKSQTVVCVDSFSQYTATIYCLLKHNNSYSESLDIILNRIHKNTDINGNGLFKLLSQCTREIIANANDIGQKYQQKATSTTINFIKTPETLYRKFKDELKLDIVKIERIKSEHRYIIDELIQTQKELWKINKNKLTAERKEKQNDKKLAYMELIKKEEEIRTELKKTTELTRMKISEKMLNTLKESLERLRCLIAVFVPHEKSTKLLEQISQIDIADVVHEIYKSCCEIYCTAVPKEYFNSMSFDHYLLEKPKTCAPKQLKINLEIVDNDAYLPAYVNRHIKGNSKWSLRRLFKNKYETKSLEKPKLQETNHYIAQK